MDMAKETPYKEDNALTKRKLLKLAANYKMQAHEPVEGQFSDPDE